MRSRNMLPRSMMASLLQYNLKRRFYESPIPCRSCENPQKLATMLVKFRKEWKSEETVFFGEKMSSLT